jgi:hypothetical protein
VILPTKYDSRLHEKYKDLTKFPYDEFSSKTVLMNKKEIEAMLRKGKFI